MTKSQKAAALWFLGGGAFILAGLIAEPGRPLAIGVGALFVGVGLVSIVRFSR